MDRMAAGNRTESAGQTAVAAVDIMALLGRCLGNFELIVRVLARFRKTGGTDLDQLGHAIDRSDFAAVVAISHRFKGAAGNISAAGLQKIAAKMEQLARDTNAAELPQLLSQLRIEWDEFLRFADAFAPPGGVSQVHPVK
jgi:HPt (histidine-containing phosphotransfer) domain-containing protein